MNGHYYGKSECKTLFQSEIYARYNGHDCEPVYRFNKVMREADIHEKMKALLGFNEFASLQGIKQLI